ncbi:Zinc ABC transporter, ATP-binding protein ZnuC [Gulosibacter sp. 10]|nr:Zinc ABC transporter, ATP-binding protein ZnuC [Gulosibacter sp. 10]
MNYTTLPAITTEQTEVELADPVLEIRDVSVQLGGRRVLQGVDFAVAPREFVGLIGPNGAGKTTLMRAALGLIPVESGTIDRGRRLPGYVPQRHEFVWDFPISVEDAVLSGLTRSIGWFRRPRAKHFEAVADALERVEMSGLARRPVGELSGGQRQRVLVARALALDPALLLLDEPFTGLDMPTQELLGELFADLAREGQAVVMTTHDLAGAMHLCSRLCLLNRTVIADDRPSRLRDPELWMRTFSIGRDNPLLSSLGMAPTRLESASL